MTIPNDLSDKALAIMAFAAYHQLDSGDTVTSVVAKDAAGHSADSTAIAELVEQGLATEEGNRLHFSDSGQLMLSQVIDRIRGAV